MRKTTILLTTVVIVVSSIGIVAAQENITGPTYSEDFERFEEGTLSTWTGHEADGITYPYVELSPDRTAGVGQKSLLTTTQLDEAEPYRYTRWANGPIINTSERWVIDGTFRPSWNNTDRPIRIGLFNSTTETTIPNNNAFLLLDGVSGSTFLAQSWDDTPSSGNEINNLFDKDWVDFKISYQGNNTVYAKIWPSDETEPEAWQLEKSYDGNVGEFGFYAGTGRENHFRSIWVDEVQIQGQVIEGSCSPFLKPSDLTELSDAPSACWVPMFTGIWILVTPFQWLMLGVLIAMPVSKVTNSDIATMATIDGVLLIGMLVGTLSPGFVAIGILTTVLLAAYGRSGAEITINGGGNGGI